MIKAYSAVVNNQSVRCSHYISTLAVHDACPLPPEVFWAVQPELGGLLRASLWDPPAGRGRAVGPTISSRRPWPDPWRIIPWTTGAEKHLSQSVDWCKCIVLGVQSTSSPQDKKHCLKIRFLPWNRASKKQHIFSHQEITPRVPLSSAELTPLPHRIAVWD